MTSRRLRARPLAAMLAFVVSLLAVVLGPSFTMPKEAEAQSSADVTLRADQDEIEVGESLIVTLNAMSDASSPQPSEPQLKAPAGWKVSGPAVSTQTQMSIVNGHVTNRAGFRASWQLVPSAPGTFEIGPVTYQWQGRKQTAGSVRVTVVPAGKRARPRGRQKRQDPFGQLMPFPFFDDSDPRPEPAERIPPADALLSLDTPLDPSAFLRAVVDKDHAVVGEEVRLSVYLYTQTRLFQVLDPHEPVVPQFFQRIVSGGESEMHPVQVAGSRWYVQLVRKIALFPLSTGNLEIGPMTITLVGQGLRGGGLKGGLVRASRSSFVRVTEPPATGRPPGYVVGDVGAFSVTASVEPRTVPAGGSVAVTAVVRGAGNPPTTLRLPEKRGISWLDPDTREMVETGGSEVTGARTFTYIVKLSEPGRVDLGEITLPYWNAKQEKYVIARAPLGSVQVTGTAPPISSADAPRDPFASLPAARTTASPYAPPPPPLTEVPWYWIALFGAPLSVVLVDGAARGIRNLQKRRAADRESSGTRFEDAMSQASLAEKSADPRAVAAAVERALLFAIEASTGVRARGMLRDELSRELGAAGVPADRARDVVDLLAAIEASRFDPDAAPAADLVRRTREVARALSRRT
jgi:hypothetical protein